MRIHIARSIFREMAQTIFFSCEEFPWAMLEFYIYFFLAFPSRRVPEYS